MRFGVPASVLFAVSTTGTSTGAVNSLHDSYTGGAGAITLLNMLLGEVAPGGVGTGLYGILVLAIIAVFLAGLMVGRTPEYLGKKLGRVEITAAAVSILAMPTLVLLGAGLAIALPGTTSAMNNDGSHGFSEVLYAYASAANNNGSAFAGITVTSDFFQSTLGVCMLLGRFVPILAVLALAGSLAKQRRVAAGAGTLPTSGPLFGVLVGGTIILVAALTFFPALRSGPARGGALMTTTLERPQAQAVEAGAFDPASCGPRCPTPCASSTPARSCATPSCSSCGWARCSSRSRRSHPPSVFAVLIAVWLWFTVLFANLAEAVAEGRGKAQAESLRRTKKETVARKLVDGVETRVGGTELTIGDLVVVEAGETIPATATSSRASRPSTSRRSPASRRRSSARRAATAARSPAAPPCCPTASS